MPRVCVSCAPAGIADDSIATSKTPSRAAGPENRCAFIMPQHKNFTRPTQTQKTPIEASGAPIRPAREGDLPALWDLILAMRAGKEHGYFEELLAHQGEGKRVLYIAEIPDPAGALLPTLAGYCLLNYVPRYALFARLGMPETQDLNVHPEYRRHGLGTALIAHCEDRARAGGHRQIGISVGLHPGFGAAQRLYARLGYVPDGHGVTYDRRTVSEGEIRPVDDLLCLMMVKDLV